MVINDFDDIVSDNEEIIEDISKFDPSDIVVYSRDWTIETIYNQIKIKNIDLNPQFQRRNAWNDHKRSKLIESVLIGYPVPEIVLAEDPQKKKSFIVIDGKQRLLTIAGYINPTTYNYWDNPNLSALEIKPSLNGKSYDEISNSPEYTNEFRQFSNSSLRCTILTNFKETDVLYDIFYRLNSGSVPLSTQELRQVLIRGDFANYLITVTNTLQPLHRVMKLKEPDNRLKDIEVLLRCLSMILFANTYTGNLKVFLDQAMSKITSEWGEFETKIGNTYDKINIAIEIMRDIFDGYDKIGRKYTNNSLEKRFNRVLFEVQLFFFIHVGQDLVTDETKNRFIDGLRKLCQEDFEFRSSLESSTKSNDNYRIRFSKFQQLINISFNANITANPF